MKKKMNLFATFGFLGVLFTIVAFLFPIGTGIIWTTAEAGNVYNPGYDFVFGNNASQIVASGYYICAFSLLIIAVVFQILGTVFTLPNPDASHKFSGFLHLISAIALIVVALFFFLGTKLTPTPNDNYVPSLGFGFIAAGAGAAASALCSLVTFVVSLKK